jgi:hypothetical protein
MKPVARLQVLVAFGSSFALLGYILVLVQRILTGGPGHIGSDLITGCYTLAALGTIAASSLYRPPSEAGVAAVRPWLLAFAVVVAALWAALHVGGLVFSHGSMFHAQPNPSIERTSSSVLRTLPAAAHVQR